MIPTGRNFKVFVKERNCDDPIEGSPPKGKYLCVAPLTGDKAKQFYEEVLTQESSAPKQKSKSKLKPKPKPHPPKPDKKFKNTDLLWMAQNNDVKSLNSFLLQQPDCDVNVVDDFGWTPLMCASCSGAEEAVKILLEAGADPSRGDRVGNTPLKLAKKKNWIRIREMLEKHEKDYESEVKRAEDPSEPFFCETCNETSNSKPRHESSTVHLFNCPIKMGTFYGIPESNKGFQLLLKEGWEKEKGLGRDGRGRKFPVKAVMKKDRKGIGASPQPDTQGRESDHIQNYLNKKIRSYNAWKDKHFEKSFRAQDKMENPSRSLKHLEEMESLGEEILMDVNEIVALDKRRNQTREGLRELKKLTEEKAWFAFGPLLIKRPVSKVEPIFKKDQVNIDAEINKIRSNLKVKVNALRDMEHKPPVPGLMLKAMTPEEMKAVGQVLARRAD